MMSFMMNGKVCTKEVMSAVRKRKGKTGKDIISTHTKRGGVERTTYT
jgi:hypothetical protein